MATSLPRPPYPLKDPDTALCRKASTQSRSPKTVLVSKSLGHLLLPLQLRQQILITPLPVLVLALPPLGLKVIATAPSHPLHHL